PELRDMSFKAITEQAFREFEGRAACPLMASLLGMLRAADHLTWQLAQQLVPQLPDGYRLLGWIGVLMQAGIAGIAYTRLQLGVLALVARREPGALSATDRPLPASLMVV